MTAQYGSDRVDTQKGVVIVVGKANQIVETERG
jgi:hypothetical protein